MKGTVSLDEGYSLYADDCIVIVCLRLYADDCIVIVCLHLYADDCIVIVLCHWCRNRDLSYRYDHV